MCVLGVYEGDDDEYDDDDDDGRVGNGKYIDRRKKGEWRRERELVCACRTTYNLSYYLGISTRSFDRIMIKYNIPYLLWKCQ